MPYKRSAMRYGHIMGYTSVAYQEDGDRILSIGHDGDIRIWDGVFDDDPITTCVAENVWAMLQYGDRVLIANDLNTVQAYKFPGLEKDGIDFRFTAFVTSLVRNERFLVAGSEDGTIKVKPVDGDEFELGSVESPVLSMGISRKDMLAAGCGDGKLRVWDLNSKQLLKTLEGLGVSKSFEGNVYFATPHFEPVRGSVLAYPKDNEIVIVNVSNWEQHKVLKHPKISAGFTYCAFSPRGDFLAAGSTKGEVAVWEYSTGQVMEGEVASIDPYPITGLAWHPKNTGELVICDDQGQLGSVNDIYNDDPNAPDDGNDLIEMAEKEANGLTDDDDDLEEIYSKHIAEEKMLADDSDDENAVSVEKIKSQYAINDDDDDGLVEKLLDRFDVSAKVGDDDARSVRGEKVVTKSYPMQEFFQSGSTPDHLEHRYLVYNHVGIVRSHSNDKENSIEAEFHDAQKHHGIHLNNYLNHTMAGLSETVLAMACTSGVEGKGSKLVCINLVAFGNREWSATMPGTEEIIGVVASDKIVAVATDSRLLRVFTARGTQREILSIPGPLVSMAAFGDHILVAYHHSPASEDQHLNLMIITCVKFKLRCREIAVPLSAGAELRWLGYSDRGSPVTFDSEGIMRLYHASSNLWFPILDAESHKAGASDNLFIVTVYESVQQVQLIVCRGAKFPLINPRPIPMNANFQQPMCEVDLEKGSLEDELVRCMYLKSDEADKILKETAVKLFALACRSEMEQRAKELIETIGSSQLIPIVSKYANKIKRFHLAESLSPLLPTFQKQEKEEEKQELETARENAAMVSELEHINLEAVTRKDTTPKIKPMPMIMRKNNPFKRTDSAKASPSSGNSLGHLTGKAIGFNSPGTPHSRGDDLGGLSKLPAESSNGDVGGTVAEDQENQPKNSNGSSTPSGQKFMPWFESNKDQLKQEYPQAKDSELIKIGMRQFKTLNSYSTPLAASDGSGGASTEKRKLDDAEKSESGVSKLARFGFVKN